MGQGIAQVALVAGHPVLLYDAAPGRAEAAATAVLDRLDRLVAKGRLAQDERDSAASGCGPRPCSTSWPTPLSSSRRSSSGST